MTSSTFLERYSLEVLPRQKSCLPLLKEGAPPGTQVYIALTKREDLSLQISLAQALRMEGFEPVPHVVASHIADRICLGEHLSRLSGEAGVTRVLAIAGGGTCSSNEFSSTLDMLRTGLFERYGICSFGFAGHPESVAGVGATGESGATEELRRKVAFVRDAGGEAYAVTQFTFSADPIRAWVQEVSSHGLILPIHVGIAGPATLKTLLRYAILCGVGPSLSILRKQAYNVTKLFTVCTPDSLIAELSACWPNATAGEGESTLSVQPHFFPLGGVAETLRWLQQVRP